MVVQLTLAHLHLANPLITHDVGHGAWSSPSPPSLMTDAASQRIALSNSYGVDLQTSHACGVGIEGVECRRSGQAIDGESEGGSGLLELTTRVMELR